MKEKTAYYIVFLLAIVYGGWWLVNFFMVSSGHKSLDYYSDTYAITALVGAVCGLYASKHWGGFKSVFGRALGFFSLGLLAQVFGQVTYSYYALVQGIEAPYPSIGDIGYFGSIIFYALGVLLLAKALGARFKNASKAQQAVAIVLPLALLLTSYTLFLKNYESTGDTLTTFLDFGYPLGQAVYVGLALLVYILSFKLLGGKMKSKILLLLTALLIQFSADFLFLYRLNEGQWYAGDVSDLLYQIAYFVMALALLRIGSVARQLGAKA
ncbi:MAG: Signaling protein ykoW [Candidatus Saccharibacteria bacterium]|nr:Signaling protein ykoW [Candidatus Saccharibacteria bacterium]